MLGKLTTEQFAQPNVCGWWSVKDIIAHIGWFEDQMTTMISHRSMNTASEWWLLPTDERNDKICQMLKDKPLAEILQSEKDSYSAMLAQIKGMQDDELTEPAKFEGMPPDWKTIDIVAQNSWEHYKDHLTVLAQLNHS